MNGIFAYYYVALLSLGALFSGQISARSRSALGFTFFLALALFTAFRYDFGYDYLNYENIIISQDFTGFEFLHKLLFTLASSLDSPQLYFIITSSIIFFLFGVLAWQIGAGYSFLFALLAFICLPTGYLESVSIVRQYIASLSFLCLFFYTGRSNTARIALVALGGASHYTFFLVLPFYFLRGKFDRRRSWLFYASLLLVAQAVVFVLTRTSFYANNPYLQYMASLDASGLGFLILNTVIFLGASFYYFKVNPIHPQVTRMYNCYAFGFLIYSGLYQISVHASRMAYYFMLIQPFLLAIIYTNADRVIRAGMVVLCNVVFVLYLYVSHSNGVRDYLNEFSLRFY